MYGGDPAAFAYIFCHNLMGPPQDSFACMYLRDTLGAVGVELVTPDLTSSGGKDFTVTSAVAALEAAVAAVGLDTTFSRYFAVVETHAIDDSQASMSM
jgi:hypothetical protein